MTYTKAQSRSRIARTRFSPGRAASKREEERRNLRNMRKNIKIQTKSKPKNVSMLSRIKKVFNRKS